MCVYKTTRTTLTHNDTIYIKASSSLLSSSLFWPTLFERLGVELNSNDVVRCERLRANNTPNGLSMCECVCVCVHKGRSWLVHKHAHMRTGV